MDWTDSLKPLDDDLAEMAETLNPISNEPDLDDVSQDKFKGLDADIDFRWTPRERTFIDLQQVDEVKDHIARLPDDGEIVHGVVSGRYPLFAIVPAVLELSGEKITDLHLVTLSYGRDNAADLVEMLDDGRIERVALMVSHYFAAANAHLYDPLEHELARRRQRMIALRTHAKIILVKLGNGITYVIESSANLRSCKNIEQFTMTRHQPLYEFHLGWIEGLFDSAAEVKRHESRNSDSNQDQERESGETTAQHE